MKSQAFHIASIKRKLLQFFLPTLTKDFVDAPYGLTQKLLPTHGTAEPTHIQNHPVATANGCEIVGNNGKDDPILHCATRLKETQRLAHLGSWTWDILSGQLSWSEEIYRIFGREPFAWKVTYDRFLEVVHPDDRDTVLKAVNSSLKEGKNYDVFHRILLPDGTERVVHEIGEISRNAEGKPLRMEGTVQDVTEIKRAEEKLLQSARVFERSRDAIVITRPDGIIVDINDACSSITGFPREEIIGQNPRIMKSGIHDKKFYKEMWRSLKTTGEWHGEVWDRKKNGEIYPKWLSITSIKNHDGKTIFFVGIFTDLTVVKQTEERILQLTNYDVLTGLPNKLLFRDRLGQLIDKPSSSDKLIAVLFLDLDNFRIINDSLGIQAGDELITQVAKRLQSCVTERDTISHFNSDEFGIILTDITQENIPFVAQWTIDTLAEPFLIDGQEVFTTASMGISLYPNDGVTAEELLRNAISAMNFSRKIGARAYNFFSEKMNEGAVERLRLAADLRNAVKREEFLLHYQPRVEVKTGRIVGMEALIRMQHPEWGIIPPDKFIPLAEETGLIVPMTEWILKTAFKQTKAWERAGFGNLKVGINLSAVHFQRPDLIDTLRQSMQETGFSPDCVDLELTETSIMQNVEGAIEQLGNLKELGCMLALDDFGTGYSSLSYLKRFPIDILKIDQAFIREVTSDSYDMAIVKTIILLARSLELKIIAEGVETAEQLDFLRREGCDEIQGFYFSKPLSAEGFTKILERERALKDASPEERQEALRLHSVEIQNAPLYRTF